MQRRFQDNLFAGIALRTIEPGRTLGLAEDVHHTVIADPIARAEVRMGVVIKRAPGDAACVSRIGRELIVYASVAQSVLDQMVGVVRRLGTIGMADELRVQIERMVRRLQRKSEVVQCEDVLEKLRAPKGTDAARLPRRIELVGRAVGAGVELMIVRGFIDPDAPEHDRRMIPVTADHAPDVVDRQILPRGISYVLPTGYFLQNEQAQLIARLQEMPRLRIVRRAHDVALELLAEDFGIPTLYATRHRRSHEREVLMAVEASQLYDPPVELEAAFSEARGAESEG